MNKQLKYMLLTVIVLCVLVQESDARRKIVRGRKAVTRQYLSEYLLKETFVHSRKEFTAKG